ncbi:unnamed protein product [Schistosoma intercalatum]|nr:unnamed protein product [Schistosoma intercalatum]
MMRFNSPYDLFIRISMILNLFSVFCNCKEICKLPEWKNFNKVIFKNDSYQYSHYYHYSQTISLNQPHPDVSGGFEIFDVDNYIKPEFPFNYYGTNVTTFQIWSRGALSIYENEEPIGQITNVVAKYVS